MTPIPDAFLDREARPGWEGLTLNPPDEVDSIPVELWTLPEAAAQAGVEYRTLHNWVKRGLVSCTRESTGSGRANVLSEEDVARCCLYAALRDAGLSMKTIDMIAADIKESDKTEPAPFGSSRRPLSPGVGIEYDLEHHRQRLRDRYAVYVVTNGKGKPSNDTGEVFPYISVTRDGQEVAAGMSGIDAQKLEAEGWGEAMPVPRGVDYAPWGDEA